MIATLLNWDAFEYDMDKSYMSQDAFTAKIFLFWFVSISSNSFAILFGIYNILFGAHPKFYFTRKMFVSLHFHIFVGAAEFMLMLVMYCSAPSVFLSHCLVLLDVIQNITIWIQMSGSSGSKYVVNGVFLYLMNAKLVSCAYLIFVNPLSRDAIFAIYFFLSGFTFTRYTGMTMKGLNLFKSMRYTLSVYSGSMICSSLAMGECGPISLYSFICAYTVYRKYYIGNQQSKGWENEAKRNPYIDSAVKVQAFDAKLKPEQKARIVFDAIAGQQNAKHLPVSNLKFLLTTSGVAESEIETAMKELAIEAQTGNSHAFTFEIFYERFPSVWNWYYAYMHSSNEM